MKNRLAIGWMALWLAALMMGTPGCHSEQAAPPPAPPSNGMPAEANQRLQQMSPEMRAKFQQQMQGAMPRSGAQTPAGGAAGSGQ